MRTDAYKKVNVLKRIETKIEKEIDASNVPTYLKQAFFDACSVVAKAALDEYEKEIKPLMKEAYR